MYNCIGIVIFILIIGALVSSFIDRKKLKAISAAEKSESDENIKETGKAEE